MEEQGNFFTNLYTDGNLGKVSVELTKETIINLVVGTMAIAVGITALIIIKNKIS